MLRLLEARMLVSRVCLHHADALLWEPTRVYDLIVTHFFLDCFFPGNWSSSATVYFRTRFRERTG